MEQILREALLSRANNEEEFFNITGSIIYSTVAYVLDGEKFSEVEGCVKSFIGVKFEKSFLKAFSLPVNDKSMILDTKLAGIDLDVKVTIGKNWMIPSECVGHWCLLCKIDVENSLYSLGLFQAFDERLCAGKNKDGKRSVSKAGKEHITWLIKDESYEKD